MNRILPFGAFILLTLCLSACSQTVPPLPAASAAPVDVVATQVAENLTAAVSTPSAVQAPDSLGSTNLLVVYEKSGSIWAWTGSSASQITSGGPDSRPQLSADGKLVAFQRGAELWAVEISGQNPRRLFGEAGAIPLQFEFAPAASHQIYFTTASSDGAPRFDLNVADADGNSSKSLLPAGQGGKFTFLPNGEMLALVQPGKIITFRADGSGAQLVYQFQPVRDYLPHVAWMDNGYGFKTVIPGGAGKPAHLMFIMAAGGQPAQLAEFHAAPPSVSDTYIAPDGSKVLYVQEQGGNLELHIIDASTADQLVFWHARDKFGILGWTPDSKNVLFWLDDTRRTWMGAADNRSPLSDVAYAANVTWVNTNSYLFLNENELRLRTIGQPSQVIDIGVTGSFTAIPIP